MAVVAKFYKDISQLKVMEIDETKTNLKMNINGSFECSQINEVDANLNLQMCLETGVVKVSEIFESLEGGV